MVINKNNLSIADHCTKEPTKGHASNVLHITDKGTLVVRGPYSLFVSAIAPGVTGCITVAEAKALKSSIGAGNVTLSTVTTGVVTLKIPLAEEFQRQKPVIFEMSLNATELLAIAQSAVDFEGEVVRMQFTGETDPIRMDARNLGTGQTWEALFMPCKPGANDFRYAEPEMSELDKAMAEAEALCRQS
jgi:hypothetical protein